MSVGSGTKYQLASQEKDENVEKQQEKKQSTNAKVSHSSKSKWSSQYFLVTPKQRLLMQT